MRERDEDYLTNTNTALIQENHVLRGQIKLLKYENSLTLSSNTRLETLLLMKESEIKKLKNENKSLREKCVSLMREFDNYKDLYPKQKTICREKKYATISNDAASTIIEQINLIKKETETVKILDIDIFDDDISILYEFYIRE